MEDRRRRVYGRRRGHRLRPARRALLDRTLPKLQILLPDGERTPIDLGRLFSGSARDLWLEIGFGAGEHLAHQVRANPSVDFIGCEPFVQGVSRLLLDLEADGTTDRVRVFTDDAQLLIERLPDACIGRLFALFPDPWPKKRHHKRRLINADTVAAFARILKDGAEFRWASDEPDYVRWTLSHVGASEAFIWSAETARDWRVRPADWPETRYEKKARAGGRAPVFLRYVRASRSADGPACGAWRGGETP